MNLVEFPYIIKSPPIPQIRMGVIGAPGTGKTEFALTFPNPVVINYDGKLRPGVDEIPFRDSLWLREQKKWYRQSQVNYAERDALVYFLKIEGPKFPPDTTLILDSWTSAMNRLDIWQDAVKQIVYYSEKKKDVDGFQLHGDRLAMAIEIFSVFKSLKCNFIVIMHEQIERNDDGLPTGQIKPLMKGQFADQMAAHLTCFMRMAFVKDGCKETNGYGIRVKADNVFRPITPSGFNYKEAPDIIPANYENFCKYFMKK